MIPLIINIRALEVPLRRPNFALIWREVSVQLRELKVSEDLVGACGSLLLRHGGRSS